MTTTLDRITSNALAALKPPPRLKLSDWIEDELRLPAGVSALPGKVHLWPFQRDIADSIGGPVERVSVVKSVRVGYSTLLSAAIGSYIANEPAPIMLLLPTESDCRDVVVSDLEPIFEATPVLKGLLSDDGEEAGRNTLLSRRFPGGSLKVVPSRAPRNLRRHNIRVLLIDECDGMENTVEGSPLVLAERRTLSFANRKIVLGSTPVFDDGHVLRAYADSDQRIYECPCPKCGTYHELKWSDITWPDGNPQQAGWRCPTCQTITPEGGKGQMVANGRWLATVPERSHIHHGYKLNALISPHHNARWGVLAEEFQAAKSNPDSLRVFVNTILAEGWRDGGDELSEDGLLSRREPFGLSSIPADVLLITVGIDMQDDRAEYVIAGHGRMETFILASGAIFGRYDSDELWQEVDDLLKTTLRHPGGAHIGVSAAFIDEGDGEHQPHVRAFVRPRFARRVAASKGMAGFRRPPIERSTVKGAPVFIVGSDAIKNSIFNRLSAGNTIRFSADLEPRYFEELVSERRVTRYSRGQPTRAFERIPGRRAEGLDATVYAIAARSLVSADLDRRETELSSPAAPTLQTVTVIKSNWLSR